MNRGGERRIHDLRPGEHLERTRLERRGAGLVVRLRVAFDDASRDAVARELGRGEQARRSRADHDHLGLGVAHHRHSIPRAR
jgi:hypothetical protein